MSQPQSEYKYLPGIGCLAAKSDLAVSDQGFIFWGKLRINVFKGGIAA